MNSNFELIEHIRLRARDYLDDQRRSEELLSAMLKVDRKDFLPEFSKSYAYEDVPLSIGYGQTCSQPSMVAFMLDNLEIKKGNKILEIGAGCGYASAIASILCGEDGHVYSVEIIKELAEMCRKNLKNYKNITVIHGDGSMGLDEFKPYDRIFISAGVSKNFKLDPLLEKLTESGIIIYPETYGSLYKITKKGSELEKKIFYGVCFVPLTGANS